MATKLPNPLSALDDRALLARFAERADQAAFEYIVKRHGPLVLGVCRRAVRDSHLAEDAFQAVFLVLARDPGRASSAASVGGWLFGIARRVALAARRRETRRERREALRASEPATAPQSNFDELLSALDEELGALPEECRAALVACFLQERTQDEAARELGWSLSTLRRRLERGKELLRARLAGRGITLGAGLLGIGLASPARAAVPALAPEPSPLSAALAAEVTRTGFGAKALAACAAVLLAAVGAAFALAPTEPAPDAPPVPAPRAVELAKWVTVSGRVVFPKDRTPPAAEYVTPGAMKDAEAMKPFAPLRITDTLIDPDNRGVANAVVWLRPDSEDRKAALPEGAIHPDLREHRPRMHEVQFVAGQFSPRVTALRFGDRVSFHNAMSVATNVKFDSFSGGDDAFNRLLTPDNGHTSEPLKDASGLWRFESNVHHWARGVVRAFDHPYFAITDGNGRFEIKSAPVGAWRLVVWHEAAGFHGGGPKGRFGTKVTIPAALSGSAALGTIAYDSFASSWMKAK
jgi:RNA polymerase sigma factor (sigma-70 family)